MSDSLVLYAQPIRGRACGACQVCCEQISVHEIGKEAGVKCRHQFLKGCRIYAKRPISCQYWSCRWLYDPDAAGLRRPDISGYMVDPKPEDLIVDGRVQFALPVWIDPKRPDAHQAPELRAYLEIVAVKYRMPAMMRSTPYDGWVLVPPQLVAHGEWMEIRLEGQAPLPPDEFRAALAAARKSAT